MAASSSSVSAWLPPPPHALLIISYFVCCWLAGFGRPISCYSRPVFSPSYVGGAAGSASSFQLPASTHRPATHRGGRDAHRGPLELGPTIRSQGDDRPLCPSSLLPSPLPPACLPAPRAPHGAAAAVSLPSPPPSLARVWQRGMGLASRASHPTLTALRPCYLPHTALGSASQHPPWPAPGPTGPLYWPCLLDCLTAYWLLPGICAVVVLIGCRWSRWRGS